MTFPLSFSLSLSFSLASFHLDEFPRKLSTLLPFPSPFNLPLFSGKGANVGKNSRANLSKASFFSFFLFLSVDKKWKSFKDNRWYMLISLEESFSSRIYSHPRIYLQYGDVHARSKARSLMENNFSTNNSSDRISSFESIHVVWCKEFGRFFFGEKEDGMEEGGEG